MTAVDPRAAEAGARAGRRSVVRLRPRAWILLGLTSVLGVVAFCWPLLVSPAGGSPDAAHAADAPWIFVLLLPLLLAIVVSEIAEGALDAKAVALLGVLAACGAALRLPSGGLGGFEPLFFVLLPAGRVLGRGFGFVLGALTLFASALITGGVGPWLPFQMIAAGWVGFFAGCLPPAKGRAEIAWLAGYAVVAGLAYGLVMNLWFWPFAVDPGSEIAYVPGAPLAENLGRFWVFTITTSLGWDIPRAVTNCVLVVVLGRPVLNALHRVSRRAAFGAPVTFAPATPGASADPADPAVPVDRTSDHG